MTAYRAEFFTLEDVKRLKVIQDVIDQRLPTKMAAQRLGISARQCRRPLVRYREDGPLGLLPSLILFFRLLTFSNFSHNR